MKNNYEIVFLAHYPNLERNNINGMDIRVYAIDSIFKQYERCYVESSAYPVKSLLYYIARDIKHQNFFKTFYNDENLHTIQYVSKSLFSDIFENARMIYVHALYNTRKIPQVFLEKYGHKIILDIHGCVPEENVYQNAPSFNISYFEKEEKRVFEHVKNFVCVSNQMVEFYKNKYPKTKDANYIVFPIFSLNTESVYAKSRQDDGVINIIYPGDCAKWQNADLMLSTISCLQSSPKYKFSIFSKQIETFKELLKKHNCQHIRLETKSQQEIFDEYKNQHFGFILRDDIMVNRISCPTKLIEYMQNGVIPIVLQPEIGDFNQLGYKYILNDDLLKGNLPSISEQNEMRKINYEIIQDLNRRVEDSKSRLLDFNKG